MTNIERIKYFLIGMANSKECDYATERDIRNVILPYIDSMEKESVMSNVNVEPIGVPASVVETANVSDRKEEPISEECHLTGIGEPRKATGTLGKMIAKKKEISASGTTLNDFERRFDEIIKPYRHSRNYEKLCVNLAVWKLNLCRWVLSKIAEKSANKYLEPNEGGFPYNNPAETLQEDIKNVWRNLSVKGLFTATEEGFADVALHFANWNKKHQEPVSEEPKYKGGDILYKINDGSKIEIIDIVADQYKFECGDEYPHYEFFGYIEHNYSKNPVSEELKEEVDNAFLDNKCNVSDSVSLAAFTRIACHFAEWQKAKDDQFFASKTIETQDNAYEKGLQDMREQMMKGAIEREVKIDAGGYPYINCDIELYDYENDKPLAKEGDKVKVLILRKW